MFFLYGSFYCRKGVVLGLDVFWRRGDVVLGRFCSFEKVIKGGQQQKVVFIVSLELVRRFIGVVNWLESIR